MFLSSLFRDNCVISVTYCDKDGTLFITNNFYIRQPRPY